MAVAVWARARRWARAAFLASGALLLGGECYGHALSPANYPLGPFPFLLTTDSPALVVVVMAPLLVAAVLLSWQMHHVTFVGNLWRALVLYLGGRGIEFLAMLVVPFQPFVCGWQQPAVFLAVSSVVSAGLMHLLYKNTSWGSRIGLAFGITLGGYAVALVLGIVIMGRPLSLLWRMW
ncbi:MAG: hypothetical protein NTU94_06465 [Planctomycetota bacterium]|nr:hypothetical protein [Planctomycetota bacterium]